MWPILIGPFIALAIVLLRFFCKEKLTDFYFRPDNPSFLFVGNEKRFLHGLNFPVETNRHH